MAIRPIEIFEKSAVTLAIAVVDANGDAVNLTGLTVYFYGHDLEAADGTNIISKSSPGSGVTIVGSPLLGNISVAIVATDVELDETVEQMIEGIWQTRWTNGSTLDDFSIPQPLIIRRNLVIPG